MTNLEETSVTKKTLVFVIFGLFSVIFVGIVFSFTTELSPEASQNYTFSSWLVLAYAAGLSMIVLPCTLPFVFMIVPMTVDKGFKKGLLTASLFGLGLITTLTLYGGGLAYLGQITGLSELSTWLMLFAGVVTYTYGLHRLGLVKIPTPTYSGTPGFMKNRSDYSKTYLMGVLVGNAGVGCTNPLFYLMLFYIMGTGDPVAGVSLGFVHGVGRAIPLVLVAVLAIMGFNPAKGLAAKRQKVEKASGILLIIIGSFLIINSTNEGQAWYMNTVLHTVWNDFVDATGMSENMKIFMMPGIDHSKMGHSSVPNDALVKISSEKDWKIYFWWEPGGTVGQNTGYDFNMMFHEPITDIMQENVQYDMTIYLNGELLDSKQGLVTETGHVVHKITFPDRGSAKILIHNIDDKTTQATFAFQVTPTAQLIEREGTGSQFAFPLEMVPVFTSIMVAVPIIFSKIKNKKQQKTI
ncbi:cytochrome c biogenesis protein CcdA [Nitrosopumilus sp. Nsub]|uniref:cytochrome c biogenesis CcdA family protein n=1 Tax=Nitrosopumilus sp. Nsub TaxID=1776294 RepID=UPI00083715CC|nr:cytochrome c biogenesis protein CcdA [Nitrosopumilus sp. Nsub]